jgi:hypothetical protein
LRHLRNSTPASLSASCYDTAISVKGSSRRAVHLSGPQEEHVRLQKVLGSANFCLSTLRVERPESVQHLPLEACSAVSRAGRTVGVGSVHWLTNNAVPVSNRVSGRTPRVAPVYRTSFCFVFPCAAFSVRITDVTISHVIVNSSARARRTQFWRDQSRSAA